MKSNRESIVSLAVVLSVIFWTSGGCIQERRSDRIIEVPSGFKGWAEIEYGNAACEPIRTRNGVQIITLSQDGRACTSSKVETGWGRDRYFRLEASGRRELPVTAWGGGGEIWAGKMRSTLYPVRRQAELFFVGTEAEFRADE